MSRPDALFHVSEEGGLELFEPRPDPGGGLGDVVWAIDEEHLPNYLLPRDCPRVTFAAGPETSEEDRKRFLECVPAQRVVAIETGWYERSARQRLFVYRMPAEGFELVDGCAGYYIARQAVLAAGCDFYPSAGRTVAARRGTTVGPNAMAVARRGRPIDVGVLDHTHAERRAANGKN